MEYPLGETELVSRRKESYPFGPETSFGSLRTFYVKMHFVFLQKYFFSYLCIE